MVDATEIHHVEKITNMNKNELRYHLYLATAKWYILG